MVDMPGNGHILHGESLSRSSGTAASAAGSKAPIVIGLTTDETGAAASDYALAQDGAEARIAAQNAAAGADGHKLQLVIEDDQSTPTGNLTAAQTWCKTRMPSGSSITRDVNCTTFALQMKSSKCNGVEVLSTLFNLYRRGKRSQTSWPQQSRGRVCRQLRPSPPRSADRIGDDAGHVPHGANKVLGNDINALTKLFLSNLKKYTIWPGGIPGENVDCDYESADLMIKGLELAGPNATRKAVIADLRKVSGYSAGGLIAPPGENFTHFGTLAGVPKKACEQLEIKGHSYAPVGKLACGSLVSSSGSG
jgi:Periplasmic binding protein